MAFSKNWQAYTVSQGEPFTVDFLDRTFLKRRVRVITVDDTTGNVTLGASNGYTTLQGQTFGAITTMVPTPGTLTIDLTQAATGAVLIPGVPGKTFYPLRIAVVQVVTSGTMVTPATINIGSNTSKNNVFASASSLTNSTAFNLGVGCLTVSNVTQGAFPVGKPVLYDVTVPAAGTGGFAYKVQISISGFYA